MTIINISHADWGYAQYHCAPRQFVLDGEVVPISKLKTWSADLDAFFEAFGPAARYGAPESVERARGRSRPHNVVVAMEFEDGVLLGTLTESMFDSLNRAKPMWSKSAVSDRQVVDTAA